MQTPTLRQLEYFSALAELLSFRRAAEACFVSQPALSAQIAQLEGLLGLQLFERDKRTVRLTAAGAALVEDARAVLAGSQRLCERASSLHSPLTGPLRLGVIPTVGPYLLPRVLPAVYETYPRLELFLREDTTEALLERLGSGRLDLLLLAVDVDLGDAHTEVLFSDPFAIATSDRDELAAAGHAELEHLNRPDVILLEEGHCLGDQTLSLCEASGREGGGFRASSLGTIAQMVAGGRGITLLPELAVAREVAAAPRLRILEFEGNGPGRSIGLAWRKNSPRAAEFTSLGTTIAAAYGSA